MKILFTFENQLPNREADAEVFTNTSRAFSLLTTQQWFHVPTKSSGSLSDIEMATGSQTVSAFCLKTPAGLRHLTSALTLPFRRIFHQADLIYTRNLLIAWISLKFGQRVVFDHYRPWIDQVPPLRLWIQNIFNHPRFLLHICHSQYTVDRYLAWGFEKNKLKCVHNGYDPSFLTPRIEKKYAKESVNIPTDQKTIVYTGRINAKKGLELVLEAADQMADVLFVLVGSYGNGPIEKKAENISNVRIVEWLSDEELAKYLFAADVLLIPPASNPLQIHGNTVLPLKTFGYLATGNLIVAGNTGDNREILDNYQNAVLCQPDNMDSMLSAFNDALEKSARTPLPLDEIPVYTWQRRAELIYSEIRSRLVSPVTRSAKEKRIKFLDWGKDSILWVVHLLKTGSWVYPSR